MPGAFSTGSSRLKRRFQLKSCGTIIASVLIGFVLGIGLGWAWFMGWLNPWLMVKGLPDPAARILDASIDSVVVQTRSGAIFTCDIQKGACLPGNTPSNLTHKLNCRAEETAIIQLSPNFAEVCEERTFDGWQVKYNLSDGNIYRWEHYNSENSILSVFYSPALGAIIGLIFGLLIAGTNALDRRLEKKPDMIKNN
jgi:hypothetical protein